MMGYGDQCMREGGEGGREGNQFITLISVDVLRSVHTSIKFFDFTLTLLLPTLF